MPTSLNCPSCGAPSAPDATMCTFCGSRLAAIACPACLGSMFVGAQFCPHCGAKAVAAADTGGAPLHCPGCGGDMRAVRLGETPMHQCAQCGSAWLVPDVFSALCTDQHARAVVASAIGASPAPAPATQPQRVRYVHCPTCTKVMNRVNFAHHSGIIVDVCKRHGVWFERDELHGVLEFVARGGLEQVRRDDAEERALQQSALGLRLPPDLAGARTTGAGSAITMVIGGSTPHAAPAAPLRAILDALFT